MQDKKSMFGDGKVKKTNIFFMCSFLIISFNINYDRCNLS